MRARIERLRAEIASDRAALVRLWNDLGPLTPERLASDEGALYKAAVCLHHLYSAVEGVLERVARLSNEGLPESASWHKELLEQMGLEIDRVRPSVLSQASLAQLRHLLGFRHFFRHAYTIDLDPESLGVLVARAGRLRAPLTGDLDALDAWLSEMADAAATS